MKKTELTKLKKEAIEAGKQTLKETQVGILSQKVLSATTGIAICKDNLGFEDNFDEGIEYIYENGAKGMIVVQDIFGNKITMLEDRFDIIRKPIGKKTIKEIETAKYIQPIVEDQIEQLVDEMIAQLKKIKEPAREEVIIRTGFSAIKGHIALAEGLVCRIDEKNDYHLRKLGISLRKELEKIINADKTFIREEYAKDYDVVDEYDTKQEQMEAIAKQLTPQIQKAMQDWGLPNSLRSDEDEIIGYVHDGEKPRPVVADPKTGGTKIKEDQTRLYQYDRFEDIEISELKEGDIIFVESTVYMFDGKHIKQIASNIDMIRPATDRIIDDDDDIPTGLEDIEEEALDEDEIDIDELLKAIDEDFDDRPDLPDDDDDDDGTDPDLIDDDEDEYEDDDDDEYEPMVAEIDVNDLMEIASQLKASGANDELIKELYDKIVREYSKYINE